jgi:hypothetical protein
VARRRPSHTTGELMPTAVGIAAASCASMDDERPAGGNAALVMRAGASSVAQAQGDAA